MSLNQRNTFNAKRLTRFSLTHAKPLLEIAGHIYALDEIRLAEDDTLLKHAKKEFQELVQSKIEVVENFLNIERQTIQTQRAEVEALLQTKREALAFDPKFLQNNVHFFKNFLEDNNPCLVLPFCYAPNRLFGRFYKDENADTRTDGFVNLPEHLSQSLKRTDLWAIIILNSQNSLGRFLLWDIKTNQRFVHFHSIGSSDCLGDLAHQTSGMDLLTNSSAVFDFTRKVEELFETINLTSLGNRSPFAGKLNLSDVSHNWNEFRDFLVTPFKMKKAQIRLLPSTGWNA